MADTKLSDLTAATSVADADLLYVAQGGVSKKATASLVRFVVQDAANTYAIRNGTTAQTLRVYNTTDAGLSNYERLAFNAGAAGDWFQVAAETAGTGVDNIGLAITPAGSGSLSAHVPDSGTGGGNARGTYSVDWQMQRGVNTRVASGARSTISGGTQNTASNNDSTVGGGYFNTASGERATIAGGYQGAASGTQSFIGGGYGNTASGTGAAIAGGEGGTASGTQAGILAGGANTASGTRASVGGGWTNTASGEVSWIPGGSDATTRGLTGAYAYSSGLRFAQGDAQVIGQPVRRTTTNATPVRLATNGTPSSTTVMVIPDGGVMMCRAFGVAKVASSITDSVGFVVEALVHRSGSTTTLASTPVTVIHGTNALALNATIAVDNTTNESVEIEVTGAAATTIYWMAELHCVQVV